MLPVFVVVFFCLFLVCVFGVRVSVTFHLMFVHIIFSLVYVAEWQPLRGRASHSVDCMSLYFDYLLFQFLPVYVLRADIGF